MGTPSDTFLFDAETALAAGELDDAIAHWQAMIEAGDNRAWLGLGRAR